MKTSAIVVGAGSGTRYGQDKMTLPYRGTTVLAAAVNAFVQHPRIQQVVVVVAPDKVAHYSRLFCQCTVVAGGQTRTESVRQGLAAVRYNRVLVHDGARPNPDTTLIDRVLHALYKHNAVVPVVDLCDSLVCDRGYCQRNAYRAVQTPQGFDTALLRRCIAHARDYTDEGSLVASTTPITYVEGDVANRKITHPVDLYGLEGQTHCATGYDIHRLVEGRPLILGGVPIDYPLGLEGHSDADAVLHAIMDALLASAGLEDIGHYFAPDDPQWQNADSRLLTGIVLQKLAERHTFATHASVSIIAQQPRLASYLSAMRQSIAALLHIDIDHVGISATTNEQVPLALPFTPPTTQAIAAVATVTVCTRQ